MPKDAAAVAAKNHNSSLSQAQFEDIVSELIDIDAEIAALKVRRKKVRQHGKARGAVMGEIDEAMKLAKMSAEELVERQQRVSTYLTYLRVPVGFQFELLNGVAQVVDIDKKRPAKERKQILARVRDAGFRAAMLGDDITDNPHAPNGDAGQAWMEGWHEGNGRRQEERDLGFVDADEEDVEDDAAEDDVDDTDDDRHEDDLGDDELDDDDPDDDDFDDDDLDADFDDDDVEEET